MLNKRICLTKALSYGLGIVVGAEDAVVNKTITGSFHVELTAQWERQGLPRQAHRYIYIHVITNCQVEDAVRANNRESEPVEEGVIVKEGFSAEMTF